MTLSDHLYVVRAWISPVLSRFSELLASLKLTTTQKVELVAGPPKYQDWVPPYPISISAAVFRVLSLRDLQVPKIPLIFISLEALIVSWQAKGNGRRLSSVVS